MQFKVHMKEFSFFHEKLAVLRRVELYIFFLERINTSRDILVQTASKTDFLEIGREKNVWVRTSLADVIPGTEVS